MTDVSLAKNDTGTAVPVEPKRMDTENEYLN